MFYVNMTLKVITMIPIKMVIEGKRACNSRGIFDEELKIMYRYVVIPGK